MSVVTTCRQTCSVRRAQHPSPRDSIGGSGNGSLDKRCGYAGNRDYAPARHSPDQKRLGGARNRFSHRLPERNDENCEISHSINRMAEIREKLEANLRREDRLRTIGRLVAGVADEIRNL